MLYWSPKASLSCHASFACYSGLHWGSWMYSRPTMLLRFSTAECRTGLCSAGQHSTAQRAGQCMLHRRIIDWH